MLSKVALEAQGRFSFFFFLFFASRVCRVTILRWLDRGCFLVPPLVCSSYAEKIGEQIPQHAISLLS